jgi:hypothetical protein
MALVLVEPRKRLEELVQIAASKLQGALAGNMAGCNFEEGWAEGSNQRANWQEERD